MMASVAPRRHLSRGSKHVIFEEEGFVFKLIAGRSMYALRVAETGALEHLYWGPALPVDVDLSYLTRSNVAQPFDPTVSISKPRSRAKTAKEDNAALRMVEKEAEELTLYEVWRAHRGADDGEKSEKIANGSNESVDSPRLPSRTPKRKGKERQQRGSTFERRLENMAWRLLGMNKLYDAKLQLRAAAMLETEDVPSQRLSTASTTSGAPNLAANLGSSRGLHLLVSPALSKVKSKDSMAEPAPPKLDQLFAPNRAPLRRKHVSVPADLSKPLLQRSTAAAAAAAAAAQVAPGESPPILPESLGSLPLELSRSASSFGGGLCSPSPTSSIDMSALDLPLSDVKLSAVAESHATMPPCFIPGWERSPGLEAASSPSGPEKSFGLSERFSGALLAHHLQQPSGMDSEQHGANMTLSEISAYGTGDYRHPTFCVRYESDGSSISPLTYEKHRIVEGKEPLPRPMPEVREHKAPAEGASGAEVAPPACTTLVVTMVDAHTGLRLEVHYSAMHHLEVIVRRIVVVNASAPAQRVKLERLMSATVDFDVPLHSYHLTQLSGSWARERHVAHRKLEQGTLSFGSLRGTSSHQHSPFFAITEGHAPPDEESGHAYGFGLVYSGSFLAEAEVVDVGRLRVNMGLQPQGFAWHLEPGESFSSPEIVLAFSAGGMGRLSRTLHGLVREHVIPPRWRHVPMPVLVNTWEAEYFNVTHDSVVAMARAAAKLDVEMIVLDDGWFGQRDDATSSLGDWVANPQKFPFGIRGLAREVNAEGIMLGLWIEPEMVSTNSKLYAEHPDWALHLPGRAMHEGRNQLVLDLSRAEVREHIFEMIAATLRSANIGYVKWDMNRHLTEAFSQALASHRQGEVMHRYTMGVYALHERFVTEFPNIRFEACSGGGGRFDLGILYFCPQVWCSDNTDALMRIKIQHGSSMIFPALSIGAHFSTVPNHITQGVTRKRTRALVAMCGTFGYELDLRSVPKADHAIYRRQVAAHKLVSPVVRDGDLYRLWDPFRVPYCAWMYVLGPTATKAVVFAFNMSSTFWSNLVPRLLLRGLDPAAQYQVSEPLPNNRMQKSGTLEVVQTPAPIYQLGAHKVCMHGAALMEVGIPLRFLTQDDSLVFFLNRIEMSRSPARRATRPS